MILHPLQSLLLWLPSAQPTYFSTILSSSPSMASTNNPRVFPKSSLPSLLICDNTSVCQQKNQTKALTQCLAPCHHVCYLPGWARKASCAELQATFVLVAWSRYMCCPVSHQASPQKKL